MRLAFSRIGTGSNWWRSAIGTPRASARSRTRLASRASTPTPRPCSPPSAPTCSVSPPRRRCGSSSSSSGCGMAFVRSRSRSRSRSRWPTPGALSRSARAASQAVVCHQLKHAGHWRRIKQIVEEGGIGEIRSFHATARPSMLRVGTHLVDAMLWLGGGMQATSVHGQAQGRLAYLEDHPCPDHAAGVVEFASGVRGFLEIGSLAPRHLDEGDFWGDVAVTVRGARGHARVVLGGGWEAVTRWSGGRVETGPADVSPGEPEHMRLLADWLDDPAAGASVKSRDELPRLRDPDGPRAVERSSAAASIYPSPGLLKPSWSDSGMRFQRTSVRPPGLHRDRAPSGDQALWRSPRARRRVDRGAVPAPSTCCWARVARANRRSCDSSSVSCAGRGRSAGRRDARDRVHAGRGW